MGPHYLTMDSLAFDLISMFRLRLEGVRLSQVAGSDVRPLIVRPGPPMDEVRPMRDYRRTLIVGFLFAISGYATIMEVTGQSIENGTLAAGAQCDQRCDKPDGGSPTAK